MAMSQNGTTCVREWAAPAISRALGVWVLQPCPHTRNNKQTDVCTSRCNSCLMAGPKHWRNVRNYKTNKTRDYRKTNSPTCSFLGHRTPSDILWAFGGKPKASALPPNRSSRRCLRLPLGPVTVGYLGTVYMFFSSLWKISLLHIHSITIYSLKLFTGRLQLPVRKPINHRPPGATVTQRDLRRRIDWSVFSVSAPT